MSFRIQKIVKYALIIVSYGAFSLLIQGCADNKQPQFGGLNSASAKNSALPSSEPPTKDLQQSPQPVHEEPVLVDDKDLPDEDSSVGPSITEVIPIEPKGSCSTSGAVRVKFSGVSGSPACEAINRTWVLGCTSGTAFRRIWISDTIDGVYFRLQSDVNDNSLTLFPVGVGSINYDGMTGSSIFKVKGSGCNNLPAIVVVSH